MASSKMVKRLVYFVVVCMVVVMLRNAPPHAAEAAVTCGGVVTSLSPCMTYLKSSGTQGTPPGPCCVGVRNLKNTAQTPADRKTACTCLKNMAAKMKGLNMGAAKRLPVQCGVSIRYAISPNTNCDTVQ